MKKMVNKRKNKKAQEVFGLSFGMIFAIILIIFFIVFAIVAITMLLDWLRCTKIHTFSSDIESQIQSSYIGAGGSKPFIRELPSEIKYVCFANFSARIKGEFSGDISDDLSFQNDDPESTMFLYPTKNSCHNDERVIKHLDINEITSVNNPSCFPVTNSKISILIEKSLDSPLVNIKELT